MGSAVVSSRQCSLLFVNLKCYCITNFYHTPGNMSDMSDLATQKFLHILYLEFKICCADYTGICLLSTAGSVKWSLLYEDCSPVTIRQCIYNLIFGSQNRYRRLILCMIISHKLCRYRWINRFVNRHICSHIVMLTERTFGSLTLSLHSFLKAFFINLHSLFFQDLLGQIYRESISVIQTERLFSGKYCLALLCHLCFHSCKNRKPLIDGLIELLFFLGDYLEDKVFLLFQFRISILGTFNNGLCQFHKECSFDTKQSSMATCSSEQSSKNVSTSAVGRQNTI